MEQTGEAEARAATPLGEAELVLLADGATFKALADHPLLGAPGKPRRSLLHSVYYDTEAGDLARHDMTLLMRKVRGRHVLRLTTPEGALEAKAPDETPRIELLPPEPRARVARACGKRLLKPWFSSRIRRATRLVSFEGVTIEAAFVEGEIVAEAAKAELREIALTLKAGEAAGLYRLGLALLDIAPLSLGLTSEAERGFALCRGHQSRSLKSRTPEFDPDATLDAAAALLLSEGLAHFLGNWPALDSGDGAEAVHQIRVALRRLRSLMGMLRRSFPAADIEFLRAEAKRIADAFGEARDWRVFSDTAAAGPAERLPGAGFDALIARADARAEAGRLHGASTLAGAATTRFALSLQTYVATRGWRNAASEAELRALGEPAVHFAARALEHLFRRVRKRARGFETLSAPERHEMRIALKQLRYAADFFGVLFRPGSAVEAFEEAAAELQEMLGAANDAAVARDLASRIDAAGDPALAFAAGAVVGWGERGGLIDERTLRRAWRALRQARRFWRPYLPVEEPAAEETDAA
jgi:triphosphatase